MAIPVRLFISYAREDEAYRIELEKRLKQLQRDGLIETWHDRKLLGGDEWKQQIDQHLNDAEIILMLVSPDFLASDYCHDVELQCALQKHTKGTARVIPIIVRPSDWKSTLLGDLQALPTDSKAIKSWRDKDKAWLDVCQGLRASIDALSLKVSTKSASPNQLVALGPNVMASGELLGTSGQTWTIEIKEPFLFGNLESLSRYGEDFKSISRADRYLVLEEHNTARSLSSSPNWKRENGRILVEVTIEPRSARIKPEDLPEDLNIGAMFGETISGFKLVPQVFMLTLGAVKGGWRGSKEFGSRIADYHSRFSSDKILLERLIKTEILRLAFIPIQSDMWPEKEYIPLDFVESVAAVNIINYEIKQKDGNCPYDRHLLNVELALALHGMSEPWSKKIGITLAKEELGPPPLPPSILSIGRI